MLVRVLVKPGSRQPRIERAPDGSLTVWLRSAPIEGRANEELTERLAAHFGVPKSRIRVRAGATARVKLVEIA